MTEVVDSKQQQNEQPQEGPKLVQMTQQEGDASKETQEKRVHKFDSKWEMIDKIKASDEPSVVVNIFRVHPEATWKEIKEVYKDISMKIEKVPNKEGIFNLLFRNHNDAIEFIRISPKPILDQKFTMRLNDRFKADTSSGWNEMGTDGHTQKFETKKYYQNKSKNYKKPHEKNDKNEDEEQKVNKVEGETRENEEEGLDLPTRQFHKEEPTSDRVTRAPKATGSSDNKGPRRFIGDVNKPAKTTSTTATTNSTAAETHKEQKAPAEDWITKKDPAVEKREAEEAKKKAAAAQLQKEKEAQQKKEQAEKAKQPLKKPVADFSDGW